MSFKLDHIHFRCEDLDATVNFYVKMFGADIVRRIESDVMPIVRAHIGETVVCFSPKKKGLAIEPNSGRPQWGMFQLGLGVKDIEKSIAELKGKGVEFEGGPIEVEPGVKVAFMKAPDNVQIELVQSN